MGEKVRPGLRLPLRTPSRHRCADRQGRRRGGSQTGPLNSESQSPVSLGPDLALGETKGRREGRARVTRRVSCERGNGGGSWGPDPRCVNSSSLSHDSQSPQSETSKPRGLRLPSVSFLSNIRKTRVEGVAPGAASFERGPRRSPSTPYYVEIQPGSPQFSV